MKERVVPLQPTDDLHDDLSGVGQFTLSSGEEGLLERASSLEVRLASTEEDVAACQRLRYQVFYEEMSANGANVPDRRDVDKFDSIADHLMVVDLTAKPQPLVVGTYRFLRQDIAERHGGFYTAQEYDIDPLFERAPPGTRFLELGRSCVHRNYRTKPTINMLWRGIGLYVALHRIDVLFGCASFKGTSTADLALPLSYLYHHFLAPPQWRVRALPERYETMDLIPASQIDPGEAVRSLPAMIRGYVRAGCLFGDGAVVDKDFGTVDVLVLSIVKDVQDRYFSRFGQV